MRLMPTFHSSFPDARAVRTALAAGAVAGLVVIAACTDAGTSSKALTAPAGPRTATTSSGTEGHGNGFAGHVIVCVDINSPPGTYKFRNSGWNNHTALVNGVWNSVPFSAGGDDPGDGGEGLAPNNGTDAWLPPKGDNSEYTVTPGDQSLPGNPGCVTVLDRTAPSTHYNAEDPVYHFGPDNQDDFQAINVTATTWPSTAQYDSTQCVTDVGVVDPQPTPCGTNNNPTRAFANYDHGTKIIFAFKQAPILSDCVAGTGAAYYGVSTPRTLAAFNESEVLTGFKLDAGVLHAWYTDEHALTLGVDSVYINNKNTPDQYFGFSNFPLIYRIEKMTDAGNATSSTTAGIARNPLYVGRLNTMPNIFSPDNIARPVDGAANGDGRPLYPGLYLTDLTTDPNPKGGDWQMGNNNPKIPTAVYGTWKGAILVVNNTKSPSVTTITPRADPAKNHLVVGPGGTPPISSLDNGYSSDIQWTVASLGLVSGHAYRAQVIVHDGDQNKTGGDVGQACVNIQN